jgi:CRISPR-associated protein Csb1
MALDLKTLQDAVKEAAAFRCRIRLQPDAGDGGKVFPPTYAGGVYAVENRRVGGQVVRCVLLDSVQSQANRMEEVLLEAFLPNWRELPADGQGLRCDLPVIAVYVQNHGWITSLTAPHRIHDAILRDSEIEEVKNGQTQKTRFRKSEIGKAIVNARLWNATAFYRYCPTALLFGTWDSTAGEGLDSAKIPRAVVSEILGVDVTAGVRTGSRIDPLGIKAQAATIYRLKNDEDDWTLNEEVAAVTDKGQKKKFGKKGKPSDINHGNVTPDMPRFDSKEIREQRLDRLPDILESHPLKLRFEVEADDGRLESHTALKGETVRIRDGAVKPGGVTLAYALHTWTLSLTQLRRLRFPVNGNHNEARNEAARTVLAALALYAFALLRERGYWLRSRCELIPQTEGEGCPAALELVKADGHVKQFAIPDANAAKELLKKACEEAGKLFPPNPGAAPPTQAPANNTENPGAAPPTQAPANNEALPNPGWEQRVIRLTPTEKLEKLVEASDKLTAETLTEEQEAADAGNPS